MKIANHVTLAAKIRIDGAVDVVANPAQCRDLVPALAGHTDKTIEVVQNSAGHNLPIRLHRNIPQLTVKDEVRFADGLEERSGVKAHQVEIRVEIATAGVTRHREGWQISSPWNKVHLTGGDDPGI